MPSITRTTFFAGQTSARFRGILIPLVFGLTVASSASLLFLVQPLSSKLILPWFGGSAAVWITCMLFFQTALLIGYLYAHELATLLSTRKQVVLHCTLLVLSLMALPIVPNVAWQPRPGEDPSWRLLGALTTSVGLPYALLASTSPLLQSWYARWHSHGIPYRYFALSNGASLTALLAYPVLIEPYLTGHQQAWAWSVLFGMFALLCGITAFVSGGTPAAIRRAIDRPSKYTTPFQLLSCWTGLAASASALLLVVTNLLTQNIAPMPLLWVLPLGIYLLTFIVCFESERWYKRRVFLVALLPALTCMVLSVGPLKDSGMGISIPLLSVALFVCCMSCHGELVRLKPLPERLTSFYLSLSGGGALGGIFVGFFAPHFFPANYEAPISFLFCPALLLTVLWLECSRGIRSYLALRLWYAGLAGTLVLGGFVCSETWGTYGRARLLVRNFYGPLRVWDDVNTGRVVRLLNHGSITHGVQFLDSNLRHVATTYYARSSGIGLAWRILERTGPLRMGVVGLGTGTLAAYGRAGDTLRFYEINPLVIRIARSEFTYLADCPAHIEIVLGDARLSMAREPSQQFDLLVIDAFSGDAIPVHLLTREAFEIYWRHLKPDGVLAVHISNRYLDLAPVVKLGANQSDKEAWELDSDGNDVREIFEATYVLLTNRTHFFNDQLLYKRLLKISVRKHLRHWTDDYSNLWQILNFKGDG